MSTNAVDDKRGEGDASERVATTLAGHVWFQPRPDGHRHMFLMAAQPRCAL